MNEQYEQIKSDTAAMPIEQFVAEVVQRLAPRIALASSLSAEDQVVTDMLSRLAPAARIFTLDTGRLPQETFDTIEATQQRYGVAIRVLSPQSADLEALTADQGVNGFYRDIASRRRCCQVRKVLPLRRELATLDAWITGLRREQSPTRQNLDRVEWDEANNLIKINPLADWSEQQVWDYIRDNKVPFNALHDRGYRSIGCAPCTRPVAPGQDVRDGRWWWESSQHKECGLHLVNGQLIRR